MIDRDSRLYVEHPNILHQSPEYGLPLLWIDKDKRLPKEKSSQISILLRRLTKQRMIGSMIEQTRSKKYSSGKRKTNSSLANHYKGNEKSDRIRNQSVEEKPHTFISAYQNDNPFKRIRLHQNKSEAPSSPIRIRLPSLSSPKIKLKQVSKVVWQKLSKDGRLKKDKLVSFVSQNLWKQAALAFVRFFEPPMQSVPFKFNQFINQINRIPEICKKFYQFQMLDLDNDGIISIQDILNIHMITVAQGRSLIKPIEDEFDKLSLYLKQYMDLQQKPTQSRTLFQTVICDNTTNLSKISILLNQQFKNQSSLKEYVHHSAYRHTFLVFGHNQKMRARTHLIEQARNQMESISFSKDKGISFGVYMQLPLNFLTSILEMMCKDDYGFKMMVI